MNKPLADRARPCTLHNIVGQEHILGEGRILNKIISSGLIPNMIFYGPPGTGKTTVANIAAKLTNKAFYKLNATNASVSDIKNIIKDLDTVLTLNGVILYLDEIQNFNKKQQQSLLEFIETGKITLIASTTENPFFYVYNAILSRCNIFEFKQLSKNCIRKAILKVIDEKEEYFDGIEFEVDNEALDHLCEVSGGDLRRALNCLELSVLYADQSVSGKFKISTDIVYECTQKKMLNYDKNGDNHYDTLSAFQKSIRGSDPQAAIHYLARLIKAGDIQSIIRRLLVIACEDIGLAYPQAVSIVKSCTDSALMVGLPEARIILAQATLLLATAPKSNSIISAIDHALSDIETKDIGDIPDYLKDSHYMGASKLNHGESYKYPHNYKNNYVDRGIYLII